MDFWVSSIISGIFYDLIKAGLKITVQEINRKIDYVYIDPYVLQELIDEVNNAKNEYEKNRIVQDSFSEPNQITNYLENNLFPTNFAKRLEYVISEINCGVKDKKYKYNTERIADFLGYDSVNELKKYYINSNEPDYTTIDFIAGKMGVNADWFKFGNGEPFETNLPWLHDATEIFKNSSMVEEYCFAMLDVAVRPELVVIRKINEIKYDFFPRPFTFHADVGAGGQYELLTVYQMLKRLNQENRMPLGVYKMKENRFNDLLSGKMYPGMVIDEEYCNYLLDDFISFNEEKISKYLEWYGSAFVNAGKCVLEQL